MRFSERRAAPSLSLDDARALRARASGRGHTRVAVRRSAGHQRGFSGGSAGGHARLRRPADPRPVGPAETG